MLIRSLSDRSPTPNYEKDRELGVALSEIKALKATEVLKDKALEELGNEFQRLEEKLKIGENVLEQKNLDIKRLVNEKKEALAAQYAAEATLRRVYAAQKEDDAPPPESIIAPLEAEIKMYKNEIAALQENTRSLERHTKAKEAALLEAERILKSALKRALIVEEIQNQNFMLRRQIEIFQEENKILDKTNRQKILEVEKLSQIIVELEEAILAGGAAANTLRDYKRRISVLQGYIPKKNRIHYSGPLMPPSGNIDECSKSMRNKIQQAIRKACIHRNKIKKEHIDNGQTESLLHYTSTGR